MPREDPPTPDQQRAVDVENAIQEAVLETPEAYPDGWVEQARFRERYDLPPFRPPRFADGTPVHEVIPDLEAELGVSVTFVARDIEAEGWTVEVDGARACRVDRTRDDAANTVVGMDAEAFREAIRKASRA